MRNGKGSLGLGVLVAALLSATLITGCGGETKEEAAILDTVACPEIAPPDAFWVTGLGADVPQRRVSVKSHRYGLLPPVQAESTSGDTIEYSRKGANVSTARLVLAGESAPTIVCGGNSSLVRESYATGAGDTLRVALRLRGLHQGGDCAESTPGEIDVCFTTFAPPY